MDSRQIHLRNGSVTDDSSSVQVENPNMSNLNVGEQGRKYLKKKSVSLSQQIFEVEAPEESNPIINDIGSQNDGQEDLIEIAKLIVKEVITRAEADVSNSKKESEKEVAPSEQLLSDPKVLEMVREFISQVLARAKEEAFATVQCRQSKPAISTEQIESTFVIKEEPTGDRWIGGLKRKHWYIRASKFFANAFERVCPCKTTILHRIP